jgi:hypothetical protein
LGGSKARAQILARHNTIWIAVPWCVDFSIDKVKYEVHSILSFYLTITNNVAATKIKRRNTMHKNTRSILGNPYQQGKKTQPNPLLYSSRERPSPPRKPSTQEGACKP